MNIQKRKEQANIIFTMISLGEYDQNTKDHIHQTSLVSENSFNLYIKIWIYYNANKKTTTSA
uniref:Uncharacterized protein n=1 Tax=Nelumbo nucifera TaxID=4432 RepID=A0A822XWS0_NELNU|nr:TPA_asm: hypothetical protein HUJ06_024678 [Nelumbo nucifera]